MTQAIKFDTGGKAHWVLERLAVRPHSRLELMELADDHYGRKGGRKVSYAAGALHGAGYVCERAGKYEITALGVTGLATLRADRGLYPRGEPTARVFARAA
ncbi:hypothetical protein [Phenylobacterium sp.]|uniref:hypothetical protein n=1 Tax=Phenylobacterium sp. TaxID=1871053 RepID=UPI002737C78C|nr:hypothetical protein [Phenylobacterium sp.]MDP3869133.1 hypothetical protein [Phenylobacterium sp.]